MVGRRIRRGSRGTSVQVVLGLVGALLWVVFVLLFAGLARRILGVPVGWTRAVIFALVLLAVSGPLLVFVTNRSGLLVGTRLVGSPAAAALIAFLALAWTFTL